MGYPPSIDGIYENITCVYIYIYITYIYNLYIYITYIYIYTYTKTLFFYQIPKIYQICVFHQEKKQHRDGEKSMCCQRQKKRSIVLQPKIPSAETLWLEEDL